ncbi:Metabotropic GABA-B receptor subtype 3A [Chytriomyces hyalinus]|nr:Metabotropic GABA-B receptor subtype 3A [Chytriomyces hyalinus]
MHIDQDGRLENTTVLIRRFDDSGHDDRGYFENGGYALSESALTIAENYPDVMAVFGGVSSDITQYTAELFSYYQIPYCGPMQGSPSLSDKNNYPYFIRPVQGLGAEKHFYQLLKFWNVSRVAVITDSSDYLAYTFSSTVSAYLQSMGVNILSNLNIKLGDGLIGSAQLFRYIVSSLERVNARYIIVCGSPDFITFVYGSLQMLQSFVGPDYVWLSYNAPSKTGSSIDYQNFFQLVASNPMSNYSSKLLDSIENEIGIDSRGGSVIIVNTPRVPDNIVLGHTNVPSGTGNDTMLLKLPNLNNSLPIGDESWEDVLLVVNETAIPTQPRKRRDSPTQQPIFRLSNHGAAYDCIMLLAHGLTQLSSSVASDATGRDVSRLANHSVFSDLGYRGVNGDPLKLTATGDLFAGYVARSWLSLTDQNFSSINVGSTDPEATLFSLIADSAFRFAGGRMQAPDDGRVVLSETKLNISDAFWYSLIIVSSLGCALSLFMIQFLFKYRRSKSVKQSSPLFIAIACVGSLPIYLNLVTYTVRLTASLCALQICLPLSGYVCIMAPLFVKNARAYFVVNSQHRLRGVWIQDSFLLVLCGGMVSLEVGLLVWWWCGHKPTLERYFLDKTSTMLICKSNSAPAVDAILWVYNAIMFLASVVLLAAAGQNPTHHIDLDTLRLTTACSIIIVVVLIPVTMYNAPPFAASGVIPLVYAGMVTLILVSLVGKSMIAVHAEKRSRLTFLSKGDTKVFSGGEERSSWNQSPATIGRVTAQRRGHGVVATVSVVKNAQIVQAAPFVKLGMLLFSIKRRFMQSEWMQGSAVLHSAGDSVILVVSNLDHDSHHTFALSMSDKVYRQSRASECPSQLLVANSVFSIWFDFPDVDACAGFETRLTEAREDVLKPR